MKGFLNDAFFDRLEVLSLQFRSSLSGMAGGLHRIKTYGQTVEFADYRQYNLGDDPRKIDWNLFGRFKKYFIKLFTDEQRMHVRIFLDCSRSMGVIKEKAEYALSLAAAFGFLGVQSMDKVTFYLIKENGCENPFGDIISKKVFFSMIGNLASTKFDGETRISDSILTLPAVGRDDGLSVIISDFFTDNDWKKAVNYLAFKKHQVLLLQTLLPDEIKPSYTGRTELIDSETEFIADGGKHLKMRISKQMIADYVKAMDEYTQEIKDFSKKLGIDYISVSTSRPVEDVLFRGMGDMGLIGG